MDLPTDEIELYTILSDEYDIQLLHYYCCSLVLNRNKHLVHERFLHVVVLSGMVLD